MKTGKYQFESKKQAESKIKSLGFSVDAKGNEYPTHNHSIVQLGYIILENGEYDDNGNEIKQPVFSDKYCVDSCWNDIDSHPYGWAKFYVDVEGNGVHSFLGIDHQKNKMQ